MSEIIFAVIALIVLAIIGGYIAYASSLVTSVLPSFIIPFFLLLLAIKILLFVIDRK